MSEDSREARQNARRLDPAKAKKAMKEALGVVKKLGAGTASLLARLKKDKSPEAMLTTIETSLDANRTRREESSAKVERLFREIADKKTAYASAAKARQRVLEMELRSKLSEYKAAARELEVLLENEKVLGTVKGRLHEIIAHSLRGISEVAIDKVIDDIEDSVSEAEGVLDATRELEEAGRRRSRESGDDTLWDELSEFDERETSGPAVQEREGASVPLPADEADEGKNDNPPVPERDANQ